MFKCRQELIFTILFIIISLLLFSINIINYSVYLIIIFALGLISLILYDKYPKDIHKIAFIILILFGLCCVILSPLNAGHDEPEHFIRAEITSNGVLIPKYELSGDNPYFFKSLGGEDNIGNLTNQKGYKTIGSLTSVPRGLTIYQTNWDDSKINYTTTYYDSAFAQNPFYAYLAQAIGILLAKIFDLNNIWMLWLGRLCNLILYSLICSYSIKKSPALKMPLFVVSAIPLSVILSSTMSSEALNLSLSILVIAYFLYMHKLDMIKRKNIFAFFGLILILSLSKVTFGAFSLLILALSKSKFEHEKDYYLSILGIGVLFVILLCWNKYYAVDMLNNSWRGRKFLIDNVNSTAQLSFILHDSRGMMNWLLSFTQIPNILMRLGKFYTFSNVNYIFGIIEAIFLAIISFIYPIREKLSTKLRVISLAVVLLIFYGTFFIQYLTWASVGSTDLTSFGISTRYFLSLFALLPLMFNIDVDRFENLDNIIMLCCVLFLTTAISLICLMFY